MVEASVRSEPSVDEVKDVMAESVVKEILGLLQAFEVEVIDVVADMMLSNERARSCVGGNGVLSFTTGTCNPRLSTSLLIDTVIGLM